MAAPHVTGALGVIMSRYSYMTNEQIRDVLLTTARQTKYSFKKNTRKISDWSSDLGVPDKKWGWGIVDVGKAMFGPGQFLGKFDVSMDVDDVWSNDISDKAIKFRQTEDEADALTWASRKTELDNKVALTPDEKAEYEIELARQKAREHRKADGYNGTLIKRGNGTLTLAGDNTYSGDTIIKQGQITALNQSLTNSNVVVENGGALKIKNNLVVQEVEVDRAYNKPKKFIDKNRAATSDKVKATIKDGGKYILSHSGKAGDFLGAKNLNINFEKNSIIDLETPLFEDAQNAYKDPTKK